MIAFLKLLQGQALDPPRSGHLNINQLINQSIYPLDTIKGAEANLYTFGEEPEFEAIQICFCTL